jgi:hypothetical protein
MNLNRILLPGRARLAVLSVFLSLGTLAATARDSKFDAYLVWATNGDKPSGSDLKPVNTEVRKKLKELPLKWVNFFEVNRVTISVPKGGSEKSRLSDKCQLEVTSVKGDFVEVSLIGKGEPVLKRTQPLPRGEMLVLGGNAPDETGWLVVLKRVD